MSRPLPLFALATCLPAGLIFMATALGGAWVALALGSMTLLVAGLDLLLRTAADPARPEAEFPAGKGLSTALAAIHFVLLFLGVAALAGLNGMGLAERAGLFLALALWLGQVSNSNAHELIHSPDRWRHRLGVAVFTSLLFGHHASAHRLVHHRHVGSAQDPNTARLGESFHRFARRAWRGSFVTGFRAEAALLRRRNANAPMLRHPYIAYVAGGLAGLGLAGALAGWAGMLWYLALAAMAQAQLLMSDYVQHYGLVRREIAPDRLEPVGPAHSWNAPQAWSGALMLNAPRHSDHHANPARPYPVLRMPGAGAAPILPHSLPVMAGLALWPRLWRRVMDPRARAWREAAGPGRAQAA